MERAPKILILLAAYNGADVLKAQVESVIQQVKVSVDILISVDQSSDNTLEVAESLSRANSCVSILNADNVRFGSAARNFACLIIEAKILGNYDFVGFCDQDDIWYRDKLVTAVKKLRKSNCDGYSCGVNVCYSSGRKVKLKPAGNQTPFDFVFESAGQGCTYLVTEKAFNAVQKVFRENKTLVENAAFHDWLVYGIVRVQELGWFFDDAVSMDYVQHDNNVIGSRTSLAGIKHRLNLLLNGWYANEVANVIKVLLAANSSHVALNKVATIMNRPRNVCGYFALVFLCFTSGRRRVTDRLLLGFCAGLLLI